MISITDIERAVVRLGEDAVPTPRIGAALAG